jgi:hypothetical protein
MRDGMENFDTNELIERYLDGSLPSEIRQDVETRIATEAGFRAEVELHRQLQAELADPKKLQLRDLLHDVVNTPLPTPVKYGWLKWLGIGLAALLVLWLGWRWLSPDPEGLPMPAKPAPTATEPMVVTPGQNEPTKSDKKDSNEPIAMADRSGYVVNPAFESRLGSQIRAVDGGATLLSPVSGANFTAKDGFVSIHFRGNAAADSDTAQYPLAVKIYNNQPDPGQPLLIIRPNIIRGDKELWIFSATQRLKLKPGLYYFTIEKEADEDLIFVGKFTVGAK